MYITIIIISKILYRIIKILRLGSGNTWPGHFALKLHPGILKIVNRRLTAKRILVTGTNGKTTTTAIVTYLLRESGYKVLSNETGANLINGIVSTILLNTNWRGELNYDYAVFELDEAAFSNIVTKLRPDCVALLNLSRDQLDRHWETELILESWFKALGSLDRETLLVADGVSKRFGQLQKLNLKIKYFSDSLDYLRLTKLQGDFNAKNINCAILVLSELGFKKEKLLDLLPKFRPAYGRGEQTTFRNKEFYIFLAKNPASMNHNLKMLESQETDYDTLLYILNDEIPDGLDVSWIYDVLPELLLNVSLEKNVFVTGRRAYDMTIRLNYAGVDVTKEKIYVSTKKAIKAIVKTKSCQKIIVLPNYSAMLEVRKLLTGKSIL